MTDRFYPVPAKAEPPLVTPGMGERNMGDFQKQLFSTSYTAQNEMRTFTRSEFPPGYGGHQPGIRDKFGYGTPGPEAGVLLRPETAPGMKAQTQTMHDDALDKLWGASIDKAATMDALSMGGGSMKRSSSLPMLTKQAKTRDRFEGHIEDVMKKYFVPNSMTTWSKERVMKHQNSLSAIDRTRPYTPGAGAGSGFNSQNPAVSWWPKAGPLQGMTAYKDSFRELPYHPRSGFMVC